MAERVRITDVSPRDGLQNEPGVIATADKVKLVELLCRTGVDEVEVSSFVSAKWIPQLGDAAEVFEQLARLYPAGTRRPVFSALVPNERGLDAALEVNQRAGFRILDKVSVFAAASETFSKKNTNATIQQTFDRFVPVIRRAAGANLGLRLYVSCIVACPFEGEIKPQQVQRVAHDLLRIASNCDSASRHDRAELRTPAAGLTTLELDLGDTIGAATPGSIRPVIEKVIDDPVWHDYGHQPDRVVLHLHDTHGRAADCVRAALDLRVRSFDGSVAGLGGCPYASTPGNRAPGNISTELLVRTVEDAGYETGVDHDALREAAAFASSIVARSRGPAS